MALLLDTQIVIWLEENPSHISPEVKDTIFSEPGILISKASVWEMAIKVKTGKLTLKQPLKEFINNFLADYNCGLLDISLDHINYTLQLPLHHRDPFDRLIISQSFVERLPVITSDAAFDAYGIERIW
ncbi:MAG: hypothetical protein JWQ96_314 [Segetibacter sp.]|jgi:PIN domain nuclease of toxin-antitoxin system|nr:hypothetical protein [Segetibacter sp.]